MEICDQFLKDIMDVNPTLNDFFSKEEYKRKDIFNQIYIQKIIIKK